MKNLGILLRNYIKQSGNSNYGIAKKAGINRTTLQKVLAGERVPSPEFIERLIVCLKLTPAEKNELFYSVELCRTGEGIYQSRSVIRRMLQSISETVDSQRAFGRPQSSAVSGGLPLSFPPDQLFYGSLAVERLLNHLIQEECLKRSPALLINVPGNSSLLNRVFMHTLQYCADHPRLKVTHLACFIKSAGRLSASCTNVDILSNLLPFIFLSGFQYDIFYYYGTHSPEEDNRTAFPCYMIFSDTVVLLSADCSTALPCREPEMVYYFKNLFDAALTGTVPLMTGCTKAEHLLPHLIRTDEQDLPVYSLEYQPCFSAYLTEEIVSRYLLAEIPDYENSAALLMRRIRQLEELKSRTCIFNKTGLLDFAKHGYLADFPRDYVIPLSLKDRKYLLDELYQDIASDRQMHRMVNPLIFPLSDYLTCILHQDRGLDFNRYASGEQNYNYVYITEQTLLEAFLDFFQYLLKASLVYSKEDTLLFIRQCADSLESQE